ncbi:MAG: CdaR family protein [Aestuariibaculum sp.]
MFFLFLFLAVTFLIFTKLSKHYTNTITFGIEKTNIPKADVVLNDSAMLNLTIKTNGFKWLGYYFSNPKIKIDFSTDVYRNDSVFVWHKSVAYVGNTQLNKNVELLNMSPDTLFFRYDVNMVKKVPVTLVSEITYALGYNVSNNYILQPDSVVVIGPEVVVNKIKTIETETILLSEVKTDIEQTVKLNLPNTDVAITYSNKTVDLNAKIDKFTEGTLSVPIEIINVPEGIVLKYFPKKINVSYHVSLSDFKGVTEKDFKVVCDYGKIVENQSFLKPELIVYPKAAKTVRLDRQQVEFIVIQ